MEINDKVKFAVQEDALIDILTDACRGYIMHHVTTTEYRTIAKAVTERLARMMLIARGKEDDDRI